MSNKLQLNSLADPKLSTNENVYNVHECNRNININYYQQQLQSKSLYQIDD